MNRTLQSFVDEYMAGYAPKTQVKPGRSRALIDLLYNGFPSQEQLRRLRVAETGESESGDAIDRCLKGYALVTRDEHGNCSIVREDQLPTERVPVGGVMDLPMDAYMRRRGENAKLAAFVHNRLLMSFGSGGFQMRVAFAKSGRIGPVLDYNYTSVLTLGGIVALASRLGRGYVIRPLGEQSAAALEKHVFNNRTVLRVARLQGFEL